MQNEKVTDGKGLESIDAKVVKEDVTEGFQSKVEYERSVSSSKLDEEGEATNRDEFGLPMGGLGNVERLGGVSNDGVSNNGGGNEASGVSMNEGSPSSSMNEAAPSSIPLNTNIMQSGSIPVGTPVFKADEVPEYYTLRKVSRINNLEIYGYKQPRMVLVREGGKYVEKLKNDDNEIVLTNPIVIELWRSNYGNYKVKLVDDNEEKVIGIGIDEESARQDFINNLVSYRKRYKTNKLTRPYLE